MDYNQLADAADRAATQSLLWVEMRDAFRALGPIDNARKELEAARDRAAADYAKADAELDDLIDTLADTKAEVAQLRVDATDDADAMRKAGAEEAAALVAKAQADAKKIIATTNAQAQLLNDRSNGELLLKRAQIDALDKELVARKEAVDLLIADTDREQAKFDSVRAMIKKLAGD